MPKFYVIMKYTLGNTEDVKRFKKIPKSGLYPGPKIKFKYTYADGDGSQGTAGNPDNHFPSVRIKMHELQKSETNPCVVYRVESTSY